MDQYAVIGNPIEHSLSPEIHSAFATHTDQNLEYERLWAPNDGFVKRVESFIKDGGLGLNVTAPFKQDAFNWVTELDPLATKAQAVNTIQIDGNRRIGFNTDGLGLVADLKRLDWQLENQKLLILGAGGATMGILQPLLDVGCEITVANRTYSKAEALQLLYPSIQICSLDKLHTGWDIVINSTSAMRVGSKLAVDTSVFEHAKCYDLTYSLDGTTPFLDSLIDVATDTSEGLGMLVEQAAEAFFIWRGIRPDTQSVLSQLRVPQPLRRFIAGAKCHKCGADDRIYVEYDDLKTPNTQGCLACGYRESRDGTTTVQIYEPK